MYLKLIAVWLLTLTLHNCKASGTSSDTTLLNINAEIIDLLNAEQSEIIEKLNESLQSYSPEGYELPINWSKSQIPVCKYPDFEIYRIFVETNGFANYKPTVLSVQKKDSLHIIKIAFIDNGRNINTIYNVVAAKELNEFKFYNYFYFFQEQYLKLSYKNVNYFYDRTHKLDHDEIEKMTDFNGKMAAFFNTEILNFSYYIYSDTEKMFRAMGFDYTSAMFDSFQTAAQADIRNFTLHSSNNKEYNPHELVHLYTNKLYGETIHRFFDEGLATMFGGALKYDLDYELKVLKQHVLTHDIDFTNILDNTYLITDEINAKYTVAGFVCRKIYERRGFKGLEEACREGNDKESFYRAINKSLNVTQKGFDAYIKSELRNLK